MEEQTARLAERDARILLFIRGVEESDTEGVLLSGRAREALTRRALGSSSEQADRRPQPATAGTVLLRRAVLALDEVLREAPLLRRVLEPPRLATILVPAALALAFLAGASTNLLGPQRNVSVLAFPLAGTLIWNLAIYAVLAARVAGRLFRGRAQAAAASRMQSIGRWVEHLRLAALARRLGRSARSTAVAGAVERFHALWIPVATPLLAARAGVVLHLGALMFAAGAIAGMYAAGIAFEYRATWESTWLAAPAVQRYVDLVLGPAASILGTAVPEVAPLRGPMGEGPAAPWIHLWATTLGTFVLIPRAVLAAVAGAHVARSQHRLVLDLGAPYYRRVLAAERGAATTVAIVHYSCDPDRGLRERLRALLQELVGARASIRDDGPVAYGEAPGDAVGADAGLLVVVFALAQTPELDVHGEFLERLQERIERAGSQLIVVLETASYRRCVGSDKRMLERRATWDRLLHELQLRAVELDDTGDVSPTDRWLDAARRGIWPAGPAHGGSAR